MNIEQAFLEVTKKLEQVEMEQQRLKEKLKRVEGTPERIDALEREVAKLEETIEQLSEMSKQLQLMDKKVNEVDKTSIRMESKLDNVIEYTKETKDRNKWLARTVVGSVILFVLGLIYTVIKIGLGV